MPHHAPPTKIRRERQPNKQERRKKNLFYGTKRKDLITSRNRRIRMQKKINELSQPRLPGQSANIAHPNRQPRNYIREKFRQRKLKTVFSTERNPKIERLRIFLLTTTKLGFKTQPYIRKIENLYKEYAIKKISPENFIEQASLLENKFKTTLPIAHKKISFDLLINQSLLRFEPNFSPKIRKEFDFLDRIIPRLNSTKDRKLIDEINETLNDLYISSLEKKPITKKQELKLFELENRVNTLFSKSNTK